MLHGHDPLLKLLSRVQAVDEKSLSYTDKNTHKEETLPYGLCVWATGAFRHTLWFSVHILIHVDS